MIYDDQMDPECVPLCDAINALPGLETFESCCGHSRNAYRIFFTAKNVTDLHPIATLLRGRFDRWRLELDYAVGNDGLYFTLTGPRGAIEEATDLALAVRAIERVPDPKPLGCGKVVSAIIPRLGLYNVCVLDGMHDGPCQTGGECYAHGKYLGEQCPQHPLCEADLKRKWAKDEAAELKCTVSKLAEQLGSSIADHDRMGIERDAAMGALEFQRSALCGPLKEVRDAIHVHGWLRYGRGSYEYNDDRWHEEFGIAIDKIEDAIKPLSKLASDWHNCPRDSKAIAEARRNLVSELETIKGYKDLWEGRTERLLNEVLRPIGELFDVPFQINPDTYIERLVSAALPEKILAIKTQRDITHNQTDQVAR